MFGLTILAVITSIIDNTLSALVAVALMGQAKGKYTFFSHLKWTPAIALGYAASILVHYVDQCAHVLSGKILKNQVSYPAIARFQHAITAAAPCIEVKNEDGN